MILFTDIGDTIIDEGTEERNGEDIVQRAECIPGARETYLRLHEEGFRIAMVADGLDASFKNMMRQHGLTGIFDAWIVSERVGADKPDPVMFRAAMDALGLTDGQEPDPDDRQQRKTRHPGREPLRDQDRAPDLVKTPVL